MDVLYILERKRKEIVLVDAQVSVDRGLFSQELSLALFSELQPKIDFVIGGVAYSTVNPFKHPINLLVTRYILPTAYMQYGRITLDYIY